MRTIRQILDEGAEKHPEKIFLLAPEADLQVTYGRLREDSIALGRYLIKQGLKKGEKISFMMENGYQTTKIFLGVMYAGFTAAPINLLAQPSQLEYLLYHSDTRFIFFTEEQEARLAPVLGRVKRDIGLRRIDNDAEMPFLSSGDTAGCRLPEVAEGDEALLLYTSGTTGAPKGVMLSHRNLCAGARNTVTAHGLTPEDRALCSLPLYHINGEVVTAIAPLMSGGSVVMPHRFSASRFWKLISDYRCTWFSLVPTMISYLTSASDIDGKDLNLAQLRFGRSASSPLPPSLHKAFEKKFHVPVIETMGLTETAGPVASNPMEPSKRKYGSPGTAVGNEIRIADRDGKTVSPGMEGEILIHGDNIMKGYYKAPEITEKTIERDGWLHTGDLGYMDGDGFLFITGRIKELIIKGGENIAPREIDEVLYQHPAVLDSAAVGIADEDYGEEILCCVVLKPGIRVTEEELRSFCREHLGDFKTPKEIRLVDDLPKGPSGKIQRIRLRAMARPGIRKDEE